MPRRTLLLSFDLEDCDQLLARRFGNPAWDRPWEGFERQFERVLDLLDSLRAKATFFVLGMTARNYPDRIRELASRGHDIAAHGFGHTPVHSQSPEDFRRDVERSLDLIASLTGRRPLGYRAPAFSLARGAASEWLPLYFHPYECDDRPLNLPLAPRPTVAQRALAATYWLRAKPGWGTLPERLGLLARNFDLATYASAVDRLSHDEPGDGSRPRALSAGGVIV